VGIIDPLLKFLLLLLLEWIEDMVVDAVRRFADLRRVTTLGIAPELVSMRITAMSSGGGRKKGVEKRSGNMKRSVIETMSAAAQIRRD
jgi:uncharacterized protein with ACT and thioredoxin-like domain